MNKILFVILLFAVFTFAANPTWTTPPKVHVASYAVNNYSHYYHSLLSLERSTHHRDAFVDSLLAKVSRKYPDKNVREAYRYTNFHAAKDSFGLAHLSRSEFVFFSGHGNQQKICLADYPMNVSSGCGYDYCPNDQCGKVYGGETRWVIFDACLVLNVNKTDQLSGALNAENVDLNKVDKLRTAFSGVHAILGFYSKSWELRYHGWDYDNEMWVEYRTEDFYKFFTKYFIDDEETVWDSFSMASADVVYEFAPFTGNKGLKPAIAFLRGYDQNGNFHDTSIERFDYTYNRPIMVSDAMELYIMYAEYGNPIF